MGIIFIPGFRQLVLGIGILALVIFAVVAFGAIVLGIYRRTAVEHGTQPEVENVFSFSPHVQDKESIRDEMKAKPSPNPTSTTELLEQLRSMDWFQFEKVVGHVYQKLGYAVTRRGGANPDGGIDLIIEKDGQRTAIQCKQWKTRDVGVRPVREFLGALTDVGIQKGIFVTLGGYTGDARQLAEKHDIEVINETGLTQMLESTDARFDPDVLELLHDTRKFCPKCERELVIRVAGKGSTMGNKFWGCSGFPRCHFTMPFD